jgi:hypothetical protein
MDWLNVNLEDSYEREQDFLDGYSFDTLLLEINCNMRKEDINEDSVMAHVERILSLRKLEAKGIIFANLKKIVEQVLKEKE